MAIVHTERPEVPLRAEDLSPLVRKLQLRQVGRTLGLAHQMQHELTTFVVPCDAPVRVVISDDTRQPNLERWGEFEVKDHLLIRAQPLHEVDLYVGVLLDQIIQAMFARLNELALWETLARWKELL